MPDPTNLNAARAAKAGDCRLMSVSDCAEEIAREAKEYGWEKIVVALARPAGQDGEFMVDMRCAGCTTLEARGLMATWFGRGEMEHG